MQPPAIESRYVCRIHQQKQEDLASADDNRHRGSNNLTSADRPADVGNKTTSGRRIMTSSKAEKDDDVETAIDDRRMEEDGQDQLAAAADDEEEPVWIARSPCTSTSNGGSWRHRRYAADINPTGHQPASEVLLPDDNGVRRRKERKTTKKSDVTSGCHRAHALFVWKRAIVEWRAMSAVIDRLLFIVFLVATILIYVVILVVLPMMKATAAVNNSPTTAFQPLHSVVWLYTMSIHSSLRLCQCF